MSSEDKCECGCGEEFDRAERVSECEMEHCENECFNEEHCNCEHECNCESEECDCSEHCDCGENCNCENEIKCSVDCDCAQEIEEPEVEEPCACEEPVEDCCDQPQYLKDLLRVQAEFDNYRKRMASSLNDARHDGFKDAIEQFLPAIDSFKMATDMITDKNTLMGIKFIEKGILDTLEKMGVQVIDATGEFNPELHQAIDTDDTAEVESGMIVKEAYKGFTYKGKVIRYSQVIVKR